jgi:hypothetical protein
MLYLVVFEAKIFQESVVSENFDFEFLDAWLMLEVEISFDEPLIQFNNLTKR